MSICRLFLFCRRGTIAYIFSRRIAVLEGVFATGNIREVDAMIAAELNAAVVQNHAGSASSRDEWITTLGPVN